MQDADEDGYGADLTLTCCLELEMFDNTNGDWEGRLRLDGIGRKVERFSLKTGGDSIGTTLCLTSEDRLNVNFIGGDWDSEFDLLYGSGWFRDV